MSLSRVLIDALRDMQYAMAALGGSDSTPSFFHRAGTHYPTTDMMENENSYELHAEVPGFDKKDIKIEVPDDHTIVLKGIMNQEHNMMSPFSRSGTPIGKEINDSQQQVTTTAAEDKENQIWVQERVYGSFFRSFHLPIPVNPKTINASCNNGVLKVVIPKTDDKKPTRIYID